MKHNRLVPSNLLRLILIFVIVSFAAPHQTAQAASISAPCTVAGLISAINTANANGQADTISLAANCTYTLTTANNTGDHNASGLPVIASDITINGNGATIQ